MSRIIRCDRCGKDIDIKAGGVGYIAWNWRVIETDDLIDGNPFEHMDFCEDCMSAVKDFVMKPCPCESIPEAPVIACTETSDKCAENALNLSVSEENEQISEENAQFSEKSDSDGAEEDEDPQPEPQKKKPEEEAKKPKGVDLKKLQDLVREGKKPQEIADYFGISLSNYYVQRKRSERAYIEGKI